MKQGSMNFKEKQGKVSGKAFKKKNGMEKLCNYSILSKK